MRAKTAGSWRSSQRSLVAMSCWLTPLPVRARNAASSISAASSATSAAARPSLCWMLGRRTAPASSRRTSAGTMPVTQSPRMAPTPFGAPATSSRKIAQELRHHSAGSSSAQPGCGEESAVGREATARIVAGRPIRTPIVDVVPISRPMTQSIAKRNAPQASTNLRHDIHEALDPVAIDRVPGVAVDLEMGADDAAVGDRENVADIVDAHAGIGEQRRAGDGVADAFEIGSVDGMAGQRTGDQNGVGKRGEYRAFGAQFDRALRRAKRRIPR